MSALWAYMGRWWHLDEIGQFFDSFSHSYEQRAFFESEGTRWLSILETKVIEGLRVDGALVLDVGVGTGRNARVLSANGATVVGVDISREMLKIAREKAGCEVVLASADMLPFRNGAFDGVVCVRVLKYVPEWRGAIAEAARVLAEGGTYVLEVANARSVAALGHGNYRLLHMGEVLDVLKGAGFSCERMVCGSRLPFPLYRRLKGLALRATVALEGLLDTLLPACTLSRNVILVCGRR